MHGSHDGDDFYRCVLEELLSEGVVSTTSKILVICGGETDHRVLLSLQFGDVTISNVDRRLDEAGVNRFAPYDWCYQDAECLSYPDNSFEFVLVHSGLHHLRCPHKGITEMYRVASSGIVGFEPNRNLFTSLGVKLGVGQEYETAAVFYNDLKYGGVANTQVPNLVYRYTQDDIMRTVQTYAPIARHRCRFWHTTRISERLGRMKRPFPRMFARLAGSTLPIMGRAFPFMANNMAFFVSKPSLPGDLFPWLKLVEGRIVPDGDYLGRIYEPLECAGTP